jgi:hypothetical protein
MHPADRVVKEELEADLVAGLATTLPARTPFAGTSQIQLSSETPDRRWDVAPLSVEKTLSRAGRPLEAGLQRDMEKRFGFDFSRVRVYSDLEAAQSAQEVNALAYAVGPKIVFGPGRYRPSTLEGRRLLAHELTHVVQQNGVPSPPLQRAPCLPAASCLAPPPGDVGAFAVQEQAGAAGLQAAAVPCQNEPHHKAPAANMKALALGAGLAVTIPPEVKGPFIDRCNFEAGAKTFPKCSQFPGGLPPGAEADKPCIAVRDIDEEDAKAIVPKPEAARTAADKAKIVDFAATVAHESQHMRFNVDPKAKVGEAADCKLDTKVLPAALVDVKFVLSEMSAQLANFDTYFRNKKSHPGEVAGEWALQTLEHNIASRFSENFLGALKGLKCTCSCDAVDTYTEKVLNDAANSWKPEDKDEEKTRFQKAMTDFIPSFWPQRLHVPKK